MDRRRGTTLPRGDLICPSRLAPVSTGPVSRQRSPASPRPFIAASNRPSLLALEPRRDPCDLERVVQVVERRRPALIERGDHHVHRQLAPCPQRPVKTPPALEHDRQLRTAARRRPPAASLSIRTTVQFPVEPWGPVRPPHGCRGEVKGVNPLSKVIRDKSEMVAAAVMPAEGIDRRTVELTCSATLS